MIKREPESKLVSSTSILIMSGFMIGLTVGKFSAADLSPYILAGGLSGFLAFIALDMTAAKRNKKLKQDLQLQIEERLERHAQSLSGVGFSLPPIGEKQIEESRSRREALAEQA